MRDPFNAYSSRRGAFWIGVLLMPFAPFAMAWLFWDETDDDGEDEA